MSPHPSSELSAVACGANDQDRGAAELQAVEGGSSPVTGPSYSTGPSYPVPDPWWPMAAPLVVPFARAAGAVVGALPVG
jgi:hypothetical protein